MGMRRSFPNPNLLAMSAIFCSPTWRPISAKIVLQDSRSPVARVAVSPGPHLSPPELVTCAVLPGSGKLTGFGNVLSGVNCPLSIAAADTISLHVDHGVLRLPPMARLGGGLAGSS